MKNQGRISLVRPKLLLGEGVDEQKVFGALVRHLGLDTEVQVENYGGKSKLAAYLRTLPATDGFNQLATLGVTRDADADATAVRASVDSAIQRAAFPAPLKVSVFVSPGDGSPGALEDIICRTLTSDSLWPCVEQLIACRAERGRVWSNHAADAGKAKVEAWLSLQDRPTIRLGEAAEAGLLKFDAAAFAPLVAFLRSL
jgi:hypothetical protein